MQYSFKIIYANGKEDYWAGISYDHILNLCLLHLEDNHNLFNPAVKAYISEIPTLDVKDQRIIKVII